MSGDFNENGPLESGQEPPPGAPGGRSLPPPAFPPEARRAAAPPTLPQADDLSSALISPDEPLPDRTPSVVDSALISPDAPLPQRPPRTVTGAAVLEEDLDEGVVTGMGDDAHMALEELTLGFDPHVHEVVNTVAKLAETLKQKGEAGLRSTPGMTRFETTLRSYCVGYLAGRRAEDEEG